MLAQQLTLPAASVPKALEALNLYAVCHLLDIFLTERSNHTHAFFFAKKKFHDPLIPRMNLSNIIYHKVKTCNCLHANQPSLEQ